MKFKNIATGKALKVLLIIGGILSGLSVVTAFFLDFIPANYKVIEQMDLTIAILNMFIWIGSSIVYIIWMYLVHKDLKGMDPDHRVSPKGAIARIVIPFYNIVGLWEVISAVADFFKKQLETEEYGKRLRLLLPYYYILYFVSNVLDNLVARGVIINPGVDFVSYILDLGFMIMIVYMTNNILKSFANLPLEKNESEHEQISIEAEASEKPKEDN